MSLLLRSYDLPINLIVNKCITDISTPLHPKVPAGFHFLEIYEPPEYTQWCHGTPPEAIASATKFGGDKADMWQYGILTIDLLTSLRLTSSKDDVHTLFHHDVWPLLQKILLHEEYLSYLLDETFVNVLFDPEDFELCHDFIKSVLQLEPNSRMSAADAKTHEFINKEWPQLPMEFTLPERVVEHMSRRLPLPKDELKDPSLSVDDVLAASIEQEGDLTEAPSIGALDVMKRKMKKMHKEKMFRRESIFVEAGRKPLDIRPAPSAKGLQRKPTPFPMPTTSSKAGTSSKSGTAVPTTSSKARTSSKSGTALPTTSSKARTSSKSGTAVPTTSSKARTSSKSVTAVPPTDDAGISTKSVMAVPPTDDTGTTQVKNTAAVVKTTSDKRKNVRVTSIKRTNTPPKSKEEDQKKKETSSPTKK